MQILRTALWAGAVAAALFAAQSACCQAPSPQPSRSEIRDDRLRRLLGMMVENGNGERLATVRDFVVEPHSGQVQYAILSTAGILGLRGQMFTVPAPALSMATVKERTLALDVSNVRWKNAPRFKKRDLPLLNDRDQATRICQFYGQSVPGSKPEGPAALLPKSSLQFATSLLGKSVISRQDGPIGRISDLLLDLTGRRPAFAIVSAGEFLKQKTNFAVPLPSLSLGAADQMITDATRAMFEQARLFNAKAWQRAATTGSSTVYRFE